MTSSERRRQSQPRRGLRREEAATYVGVGLTKFDEWVAAGRMPQPKIVDGVIVWDIDLLDLFFDALPQRDQPAGKRAKLGEQGFERPGPKRHG